MVPRRSLIVLLVLAGFLAAAATASASFNIDVEVADQQEPIPVGGSEELTVTVTVVATSDWVCPTGGSFNIGLSVEDEASDVGFMGDISPGIDFSVEGGVHGGATDRWADEGEATFTPRITTNLERGHLQHTYRIVATFDGGGGPGDCVEVPPGEEWSEAEGSTSVNIEAAPPEEDDDENGENGNGNGDGQDETEEGPAPFVGLVILGAMAWVALHRRR